MSRELPEISWNNTLGFPDGVALDDATRESLQSCLEVKMPPPVILNELIQQSSAFPISFPIDTARCSTLKDQGIRTDILEVRWI